MDIKSLNDLNREFQMDMDAYAMETGHIGTIEPIKPFEFIEPVKLINPPVIESEKSKKKLKFLMAKIKKISTV